MDTFKVFDVVRYKGDNTLMGKTLLVITQVPDSWGRAKVINCAGGTPGEIDLRDHEKNYERVGKMVFVSNANLAEMSKG